MKNEHHLLKSLNEESKSALFEALLTAQQSQSQKFKRIKQGKEIIIPTKLNSSIKESNT